MANKETVQTNWKLHLDLLHKELENEKRRFKDCTSLDSMDCEDKVAANKIRLHSVTCRIHLVKRFLIDLQSLNYV